MALRPSNKKTNMLPAQNPSALSLEALRSPGYDAAMAQKNYQNILADQIARLLIAQQQAQASNPALAPLPTKAQMPIPPAANLPTKAQMPAPPMYSIPTKSQMPQPPAFSFPTKSSSPKPPAYNPPTSPRPISSGPRGIG